jgi:hypothetical protein
MFLLFVLMASLEVTQAHRCSSETTKYLKEHHPEIYESRKDQINIKHVAELTFERGHFAESRRNPAHQQIKCNFGCELFKVQKVQCLNYGFDNYDYSYIWKCTATSLPEHLMLTHTKVTCEGYDTDNEITCVLRGSCQVEYGIRDAATKPILGPLIITVIFLLIIIRVFSFVLGCRENDVESNPFEKLVCMVFAIFAIPFIYVPILIMLCTTDVG